jgi:6-phosphogluconolactonase/glucosamine-6-phosphate isomerase/deaminase
MSNIMLHDQLANPAQSAGEHLESLFLRDIPTLFLASGGSALAILDYIDPAVLPNDSCVGVLDERFSLDPAVNNFAQVLASPFGEKLQDQEVELINTTIRQTDTLAALADRFNEALSHWLENHPTGQVIATVGIGTDGHIAGLMPTETAAQFKRRFSGEKLATGYEVPPAVNQYTKRVTTTPAFFTHRLDRAVVFATGAKKQAVLETLVSKNVPIHKTPAQLLKQVDITIFTDQFIRSLDRTPRL